MNVFKQLKDKYSSIKFCLKHPGKNPSITYMKYAKEYKFGGKKVLNLGCGNTVYPAKNVINLDLYPVPGVDVVHNLSKPLPFKDGEFDFIIANHILEHIPDWWNCFKELARVVKVGGIIEVWLPGDGGSSQLGYRDHINIINSCSFVGVRGTCRNFANAWEELDRDHLGYVKDLEISLYISRLLDLWWIAIMPNCIQHWMSIYLRNIIAESGWKFTRLPSQGEKTDAS